MVRAGVDGRTFRHVEGVVCELYTSKRTSLPLARKPMLSGLRSPGVH